MAAESRKQLPLLVGLLVVLLLVVWWQFGGSTPTPAAQTPPARPAPPRGQPGARVRRAGPEAGSHGSELVYRPGHLAQSHP